MSSAKLSAYVSFPLVCQGCERLSIFFKGEKSTSEGSVFACHKGGFDQSHAWACHPFLLTNRGPFPRILARLAADMSNSNELGCSLKFHAANLTRSFFTTGFHARHVEIFLDDETKIFSD